MRIKSLSQVFMLVATFAVSALASQANAVVIDFESVTTGGCQVQNGGSVDGFTLGAFDGDSSGGFNNSTACSFLSPTANSGQNFMTNYNSLTAEFTKDVGTFDLASLFVTGDLRVGATTVQFQGLDGVNGNVLYSMNVDITSAWQEVVFTDWTNVKTFTWNSLIPDVSNISIDDFTYDVQVPEAGSLALLGFGLLGLAFSRRREV